MSFSRGPLETLQDVVDWRLCIGCGACYYAEDEGAVDLVDLDKEGILPRFHKPIRNLSYCPGANVDGDAATDRIVEDDPEIGPSLEIWQGFASDPDIRRKGSSGALLTALARHCLEERGFEGVIHSAMDPARPWANKTTVSTTAEELIQRAGSRYAPSSPCDGLDRIEAGGGRWVFIGKPCDTSAVTSLRRDRPNLDRKLGVVLTFFCAGTPANAGAHHLISALGARRETLTEVHYRGDGWPGDFRLAPDQDGSKRIPYEEAWSRLTSYRPLRCNLCPDGTGRVADISCGDAWNVYDQSNADPGQSLVIVRTERGREIVRSARQSGAVTLRRVGREAVLDAQASLLGRRRLLFGRLLALRALGAAVPCYKGFSLFSGWRTQSSLEKLRSVLGTVRRGVRKSWWRRRIVAEESPGILLQPMQNDHNLEKIPCSR